MGELNIFQKIRQLIGNIGWILFIWGNDITEEKYWDLIYEQEKRRKNF